MAHSLREEITRWYENTKERSKESPLQKLLNSESGISNKETDIDFFCRFATDDKLAEQLEMISCYVGCVNKESRQHHSLTDREFDLFKALYRGHIHDQNNEETARLLRITRMFLIPQPEDVKKYKGY